MADSRIWTYDYGGVPNLSPGRGGGGGGGGLSRKDYDEQMMQRNANILLGALNGTINNEAYRNLDPRSQRDMLHAAELDMDAFIQAAYPMDPSSRAELVGVYNNWLQGQLKRTERGESNPLDTAFHVGLSAVGGAARLGLGTLAAGSDFAGRFAGWLGYDEAEQAMSYAAADLAKTSNDVFQTLQGMTRFGSNLQKRREFLQDKAASEGREYTELDLITNAGGWTVAGYLLGFTAEQLPNILPGFYAMRAVRGLSGMAKVSGMVGQVKSGTSILGGAGRALFGGRGAVTKLATSTATGLSAAAQNMSEVINDFERRPMRELVATPMYIDARVSGMSHEQALLSMRRAATDATAVVSFLANAAFGSYMENSLLRLTSNALTPTRGFGRKLAAGFFGSILSEAATEAIEEGGMIVGESKGYDPNAWAGAKGRLAGAAVAGGLYSGLMGLGSAFNAARTPSTTFRNIYEDLHDTIQRAISTAKSQGLTVDGRAKAAMKKALRDFNSGQIAYGAVIDVIEQQSGLRLGEITTQTLRSRSVAWLMRRAESLNAAGRFTAAQTAQLTGILSNISGQRMTQQDLNDLNGLVTAGQSQPQQQQQQSGPSYPSVPIPSNVRNFTIDLATNTGKYELVGTNNASKVMELQFDPVIGRVSEREASTSGGFHPINIPAVRQYAHDLWSRKRIDEAAPAMDAWLAAARAAGLTTEIAAAQAAYDRLATLRFSRPISISAASTAIQTFETEKARLTPQQNAMVQLADFDSQLAAMAGWTVDPTLRQEMDTIRGDLNSRLATITAPELATLKGEFDVRATRAREARLAVDMAADMEARIRQVPPDAAWDPVRRTLTYKMEEITNAAAHLTTAQLDAIKAQFDHLMTQFGLPLQSLPPGPATPSTPNPDEAPEPELTPESDAPAEGAVPSPSRSEVEAEAMSDILGELKGPPEEPDLPVGPAAASLDDDEWDSLPPPPRISILDRNVGIPDLTEPLEPESDPVGRLLDRNDQRGLAERLEDHTNFSRLEAQEIERTLKPMVDFTARLLGVTPNDMLNRLVIQDIASNRGTAVSNLKGQLAWHGTHANGIKSFDLKYLGTGEGAQAYGWGFYFARDIGTASAYKRDVTERHNQDAEMPASTMINSVELNIGKFRFQFNLYKDITRIFWYNPANGYWENTNTHPGVNARSQMYPNRLALDLAQRIGYNIDSYASHITRQKTMIGHMRTMYDMVRYQISAAETDVRDAESRLANFDTFTDPSPEDLRRRKLAEASLRHAKTFLQRATKRRDLWTSSNLWAQMEEKFDSSWNQPTDPNANRGAMYSVLLPRNDMLLDTRKTLAEQSNHVKNALRRLENDLTLRFSDDMNGMKFYHALVAHVVREAGNDPNSRWARKDAAKSASEALQDAGIPGHIIQAHVENSVNYVIWDERYIQNVQPVNVEIVENSDIDREYDLRPQGYSKWLTKDFAELVFMPGADVTTAARNLFSFALQSAVNTMDASILPAELKSRLEADLNAMAEYVGVASWSEIKESQREILADAFSRHIRDREGTGFAAQLRRAFDAVATLVRSLLRHADLKITPEVRAAFDNFLSGYRMEDEVAAPEAEEAGTPADAAESPASPRGPPMEVDDEGFDGDGGPDSGGLATASRSGGEEDAGRGASGPVEGGGEAQGPRVLGQEVQAARSPEGDARDSQGAVEGAAAGRGAEGPVAEGRGESAVEGDGRPQDVRRGEDDRDEQRQRIRDEFRKWKGVLSSSDFRALIAAHEAAYTKAHRARGSRTPYTQADVDRDIMRIQATAIQFQDVELAAAQAPAEANPARMQENTRAVDARYKALLGGLSEADRSAFVNEFNALSRLLTTAFENDAHFPKAYADAWIKNMEKFAAGLQAKADSRAGRAEGDRTADTVGKSAEAREQAALDAYAERAGIDLGDVDWPKAVRRKINTAADLTPEIEAALGLYAHNITAKAISDLGISRDTGESFAERVNDNWSEVAKAMRDAWEKYKPGANPRAGFLATVGTNTIKWDHKHDLSQSLETPIGRDADGGRTLGDTLADSEDKRPDTMRAAKDAARAVLDRPRWHAAMAEAGVWEQLNNALRKILGDKSVHNRSNTGLVLEHLISSGVLARLTLDPNSGVPKAPRLVEELAHTGLQLHTIRRILNGFAQRAHPGIFPLFHEIAVRLEKIRLDAAQAGEPLADVIARSQAYLDKIAIDKLATDEQIDAILTGSRSGRRRVGAAPQSPYAAGGLPEGRDRPTLADVKRSVTWAPTAAESRALTKDVIRYMKIGDKISDADVDAILAAHAANGWFDAAGLERAARALPESSAAQRRLMEKLAGFARVMDGHEARVFEFAEDLNKVHGHDAWIGKLNAIVDWNSVILKELDKQHRINGENPILWYIQGKISQLMTAYQLLTPVSVSPDQAAALRKNSGRFRKAINNIFSQTHDGAPEADARRSADLVESFGEKYFERLSGLLNRAGFAVPDWRIRQLFRLQTRKSKRGMNGATYSTTKDIVIYRNEQTLADLTDTTIHELGHDMQFILSDLATCGLQEAIDLMAPLVEAYPALAASPTGVFGLSLGEYSTRPTEVFVRDMLHALHRGEVQGFAAKSFGLDDDGRVVPAQTIEFLNNLFGGSANAGTNLSRQTRGSRQAAENVHGGANYAYAPELDPSSGIPGRAGKADVSPRFRGVEEQPEIVGDDARRKASRAGGQVSRSRPDGGPDADVQRMVGAEDPAGPRRLRGVEEGLEGDVLSGPGLGRMGEGRTGTRGNVQEGHRRVGGDTEEDRGDDSGGLGEGREEVGDGRGLAAASISQSELRALERRVTSRHNWRVGDTLDDLRLSNTGVSTHGPRPYPPASLGDSLRRLYGRTKAFIWGDVNDEITYSRLDARGPAVPESLRIGPSARTDLTIGRLDAGRDRAAARYQPPESLYAQTNQTVGILENAERHKALAVRLRGALEDYTAAFREWAYEVFPHTGQRGDSRLLHAFDNMYPLTKAAYARMAESALRPVAAKINQMSKRLGVAPEYLRDILDKVPTVYHIITEGAAAYRSTLVEDAAETEAAAVEAEREFQSLSLAENAARAAERAALDAQLAAAATPADRQDALDKIVELNLRPFSNAYIRALDVSARAKTLADETRVVLELYDQYQATGVVPQVTAAQAAALGIGEDQYYLPPVPGGINLVDANKRWRDWQQFLPADELEAFARTVADAFEAVNLERTEAGAVRRGAQRDWHDFLAYVPLMTPHRVSGVSGTHDTGYIANPKKVDYMRSGSTTEAEGAVTLLELLSERAALEIGSRDFTTFLHETWGKLKAAGNTRGLARIPLNRDESGSLTHSADNNRLFSQPGFIHREFDQEGRVKAYKYTFDFEDAQGRPDVSRTKALLGAIAQIHDRNPILAAMTTMNRWTGQFFTKLRPVFAPTNMIRDIGERMFNVFSRGTYVREDGTYVEGSTVAAGMARLIGNMDFLSTFSRKFLGFGSGNSASVFNQYWDEFKNSAANATFNDYINQVGRDNAALAGPQAVNALARAIRSAAGTKGFKAAEATINGYNNLFGAFPIFLQYAALRQQGIPVRSAAAYALDSMNFYKRGRLESWGSALFVFFRPAVQGGANLIRALDPTSKATPWQRARGATALASITAVGMMLTSMLRAAGEDDDEEKNVYDELPLDTVSRYVCVPLPEGDVLKLPVPFGLGNLGWLAAQVADRVGRGQMSHADGINSLVLGAYRQVLPETFPSYRIDEDPLDWIAQTFAPQPIRPWVDVAVNKNHWGSEIVYGNAKRGLRDHEKGRLRTPRFWWDAAKWLDDNGLPDVAPESLRHVVSYYFYGPLQGMIAAADASRLYEPDYATTRDSLGPFLTFIGASTVWTAPSDHRQSWYFESKRAADQAIYDRRILVTDAGNDTREDRIAYVRKNAAAAGMGPGWIRAYLLLDEAERELKKIDQETKERFNKTRVGDLTDDLLRGILIRGDALKAGVYKRFFDATRGVDFTGQEDAQW